MKRRSTTEKKKKSSAKPKGKWKEVEVNEHLDFANLVEIWKKGFFLKENEMQTFEKNKEEEELKEDWKKKLNYKFLYGKCE